MQERDPTAGNERLTATAGAILLVLLAVEGVTILSIGQLLSFHIVVGLLIIPPVLLKLASTGYRTGARHAARACGARASGPCSSAPRSGPAWSLLSPCSR